MNVYIAAPFSCRNEAISVMSWLEQQGHGVTSRWLWSDHGDEGRAAREDLEDVRAADVLLALNFEGWQEKGRGGRHVEFGYALGLDLRLIIVGPRENVFHSLPSVEQYDTFEECLAALGTVMPIPAGRIHDAAFVSNPLDLRDAHENREAPIDA